jgi:hypothetical protein
MSQMQEIIVYRNPAEAAMWHFITGFDNLVPLVCGLIIGAIVFASCIKIADNICRRDLEFFKCRRSKAFNIKSKLLYYVSVGAGVGSGLYIMKIMWI